MAKALSVWNAAEKVPLHKQTSLDWDSCAYHVVQLCHFSWCSETLKAAGSVWVFDSTIPKTYWADCQFALCGDFDWWRYQKQIENAGGKILGQEKFAELKNMAWPACWRPAIWGEFVRCRLNQSLSGADEMTRFSCCCSLLRPNSHATWELS